MKSFIAMLTISLFFSFNIYSYDNQRFSKLSASFVNIKDAKNKESALEYAKQSVNILDSYSIKEIKKYSRYNTLGNIYMYYGFLIKNEKDVDETIRAFNRALEIRNDPNSHKELATSYKKKYNEAILDGNKKQEKHYGQKIYYHLDKYIVIAKIKDKRWDARLNYFEVYMSKTALAKSKKQKNKKI